eukprot:5524727-Alexandrium_andersonii.AAC.1
MRLWKAEDLEKWLADFGWTSVSVQSPPRGRLGWLVRGRPNRQGEVWGGSAPQGMASRCGSPSTSGGIRASLRNRLR